MTCGATSYRQRQRFLAAHGRRRPPQWVMGSTRLPPQRCKAIDDQGRRGSVDRVADPKAAPILGARAPAQPLLLAPVAREAPSPEIPAAPATHPRAGAIGVPVERRSPVKHPLEARYPRPRRIFRVQKEPERDLTY
jgi:hypothetical protein